MIMKDVKHILFFILCFYSVLSEAQLPKSNFMLNIDETGTTRNYVARDSIRLKTGFHYKALTGYSFRGSINTSVIINTIVQNPVPGVTPNPGIDAPYTPGSSYGNDAVQSVMGIPDMAKTTNHPDNSMKVSTYPVLWLKTVPLTNNLNGYYHWKDLTGNTEKVVKYSPAGTGSGDEYLITREKVRTYNFNPAMDITYDSVSKEILVKNTNLSQTTIIGVWGAKQDYEEPDQYMFALNGKENKSILFNKSIVLQADTFAGNLPFGNDTLRNFLYSNKPVEGADVNKFKEKALRVGTYYRAGQPDTSPWGEKLQAVISMGGRFDTANINNTSRFKPEWHNMDFFRGSVPELLVFDRQLSSTEIRKYETYLAIKYGLTLDKSYLSVRDSVLWNREENTLFNNRITGYGREDALGLYQKTAGTSYEEGPFSDLAAENDFYDSGDSYKQSSANKLLVMGTEPGNSMSDGRFVIFGDNNDSINKTDSVPGMVILKRRWLVTSNFNQQPGGTLNWKVDQGITFGTENNFKREITKSAGQSALFAVTTDSLKGTDGYFGWKAGQIPGPLTVKFGTQTGGLTPNSYDYGYKIDNSGQVYCIQKGIVHDTAVFAVDSGQHIEIEKCGQLIYLKSNGVRYKNTEFVIDDNHKDQKFYGALSLGPNNSGIVLSDFRHGGFTDTGNRIELSYKTGKAFVFTPYRYRENTYILINRNGETEFTEASEMYPCSDPDEARSKIIFNNIFWNCNNESDKVMFTFGYRIPVSSQVNKRPRTDDTEPKADLVKNDSLLVYYKNPRELSQVTLRIETSELSPVAIEVYDISGRIIYRNNLLESSDIRYIDIDLPSSGVFVIKVTTNKKKYFQKVISKT